MANEGLRTKILHRVFALGIWVKGIDGVLEIIGGFILLLRSNVALNGLVVALTQHELVDDPHDSIANAALLVAELLRSKWWAYPAAIGFLSLFIAYQLYRLSYHYSLGLLLLILLDVVIMVLIWHEYRFLNR